MLTRTHLFVFALGTALGIGCGDNTAPTPDPGPHIIYIDVDDHGLKALWDANAPHLQQAAREGVLAYTKVDFPTHSNQSNMTLLTGAYPEATDLPHNSWLDRTQGYREPFSLTSSLTAGSYIYWDQNPLERRVESVYTSARALGVRSAYVGLLPPWEKGADESHFTIYQSELLGLLRVTRDVANTVFTQLHYPESVYSTYHYDGPPMKGEQLNHFTLRDAAELYKQAANGGPPPPHLMFIWTFIALDGNPTNEDGADGPGVIKIVEDIDDGVAVLMDAVKKAGYADETSYVFTLDHGKVNTTKQAVFEKQLEALVASQGAAHGVGPMDWTTLNEDGDVLLYAKVAGAGTSAGALAQTRMTHGLVELVQSGALMGVDTTRTITWDGYLGTRRFHDIRSAGPNNPDIVVFPQDDWTLNDVAENGQAGPIGRAEPYGRHGGLAEDEIYVPALFWGPAFKKGVTLPSPIDHVDVAATVAAALGAPAPKTLQGITVQHALANDTSGAETAAFPADPHTTRADILLRAGYLGTTSHLAAPADGAIVIDVAGLSGDVALQTQAAALAASGTSFSRMQTRYRDWPTTEYHMLTGTYPSGLPWVPFAEGDPSQTFAPGLGRLMMPPAANFVSDQSGYDAWHTGTNVFADQTIFSAAKGLGFSTAIIGTPDFHLQHIATADLDATPASGMALSQFLAAHPRSVVWYAAGSAGTDGVLSAENALAEVQVALAASGHANRYLVVITSRGAAPIDAPNADAHGPGSARHVPLVLAGPNIRSNVISGASARSADLAPTILFAIGAPARAPDIAYGTLLDGGTGTSGEALPLPHGAKEGRVLVEAFAR